MQAVFHTHALPLDFAEEIPDPQDRFVRRLAALSFEAVEGIRSIHEIGTMLSIGAARQLAVQRTAHRERGEALRDTRRCVPSPGRIRLCRIFPHIAEATVVLHTEHRSYAVALRLEWAHGHWRACEVYVM